MKSMAKRIAIGVGVLLLAIPAAGFFLWLTVGGGAWLGNVEVFDVSRSDVAVEVGVDSCNGSPRPAQEIEVVGDTVIVQIQAFSTPLSGGDACAEILPLFSVPDEVTILRDLTSGQEFEIPAPN